MFVIALNTTAINSAVNAMADDLGLTSSELVWAINVYLLATAAIVATAGQLGDVFGVRTVVLVGLALFVIASVVTATADSSLQLIAGRAGQGLAAAFLMPGSMSAIQLAFPPGQRASALGIWGATAGIGFAVGPVFGGIWTDALSWRGIFWTDVPILLATAALALATLGGLMRPERRKPLDFEGAAALAVALFLLVLGIQQGGQWGWTSATLVAVLAGSTVAFVVFAVIEQRRRYPLMHLRLLGNRTYAGGNVATFVATAALIGLLYFFTLFVQSVVTLDFSAVRASLVLLPYGISMFLFALIAGRAADRVGYALPVGGGLLACGAGFLMFAIVAPDLSESALWLPLVLTGIGVGATFATGGAAGMSVVPEDEAGEAAGTINVSRYVGGAVGLAVGAALYVGVAVDRFNQQLVEDGIGEGQRESLDTALTGSPAGLQSTLQDLGNPPRDLVADAAQQATIDGFAAAMWFLAALCVAGGIVAAFTLPRRAPGGLGRSRRST